MQKSKLPSLITILVLTLITVLMWIGFTVYSAITRTPEPSVPTEVSATIVPSLDTDTINKIESGIFFNAGQIPPLTLTASPGPSNTPIPKVQNTPVASASGTPTASPTVAPTP